MDNWDVEDIESMNIEGLVDTHLPDPYLYEYYRRLSNREILWNCGVDSTIIDVSMLIQRWNREDKGKPVEKRVPIKIFINTDGGSIEDAMNVIDMISISKTPVYTIGMSKVLSAGGILLMAGHKRYIFKNTICLIHDGMSGAVGNIGKMIDTLSFTQDSEKRLKKFVVEHTKISEELYDANYRKDWYLFSEEMIEYGVADEIITDIDLIL